MSRLPQNAIEINPDEADEGPNFDVMDVTALRCHWRMKGHGDEFVGTEQDFGYALDGWEEVDIKDGKKKKANDKKKKANDMKGEKFILTQKHQLCIAYYCSCAILQNKGNKEEVRVALEAIPDHLFDRDHSNCGEWCAKKRGGIHHRP